MHKLIEYIDDTMREYEDKVARGGELSSKDVECLKDLAKTKMAILTNKAILSDTAEMTAWTAEHHTAECTMAVVHIPDIIHTPEETAGEDIPETAILMQTLRWI